MVATVTLVDEVVRLVREEELEKGYKLCFEELTNRNESDEVYGCLALLSMITGNHELVDMYLNKCTDFKRMLDSDFLGMMKKASDPIIKKRWDNYRRNRNQQELKRMAATAPLCKGNVLEIGCANGDLSIFIASHGARLYGIDIDPVAIDLARHKTAELGIDTCKFQLGNGYELQYKDNTFDTVVVAEVLEHVDDPKKIIMEAYRVCKPDGKVIISVPNRYSIPDPDHCNIFTKEILNNLVEYAVDSSLEWVDDLPKEWIMGTLIKSGVDADLDVVKVEDIDSLFLPQPFSIPLSDALVSVIVPTYNRKDYLTEAVQSILDQTHKNIQIIVVDDGSVVSPKEELGPFGEKVQYLYKENGGKSSALNFAINMAKGEYIWVFDDDDIALPMKLELQLKRFSLNPKLGLVHTRSINFLSDTGEINSLQDLSPFRGNLDFKLLFKGCFIHGPTVLFKRECVEQIGGWDETLIRAQDYDFWLRIARHYEMEYLPVPTVKYRLHTGSRGSADKPVAYTDVVSATNDYEQLIFKKLYGTIAINEIYPDAFASVDVVQMLEAFLDRAVVYARKNLLHEVKLDIGIVYDNTVSFGNPCFSSSGIQNIHQLANLAVNNNWVDQDLVRSVLELLNLVTSKD
ncbi:glycosyltransferase [Paenibacillus sp. Y412MC10]|uniref:glycosyltransferase n=1 Tax=Geobacillus sp. (strain Y412MC10) TaxID=481743 RepID=UPI0011AA7428|nr:glycosyltransferase [Paenibacillus sp. Y412MC10]